VSAVAEHSLDAGAVIPPDVYDPNVNALRFLAVDAVNRAESGHPGTPLDIAPVIYRLYTRHLRHDPVFILLQVSSLTSAAANLLLGHRYRGLVCETHLHTIAKQWPESDPG
jgi:hypothetical protein